MATTVKMVLFTWVDPTTDRDFGVIAEVRPATVAARDERGRPTECDTQDTAYIISALHNNVCYADRLPLDQLEAAAIAAYHETSDHATDLQTKVAQRLR